jgi:hydroxymethylbilane synthase
VPVTMPLVDQSLLTIAAFPPREDPRDILASPHAKSLGGLAIRARIGTSSLRRKCQLLALRPDLDIQVIRGNIDTRIRKLKAGEFDGIILAIAGVKRAKLFDPTLMYPIDLDQMLPAPGQGALALQCRKEDKRTIEILAKLNDPLTQSCVQLERDLVCALNGDCHSPIAAYALAGTEMTFHAAVGARDGGLPVIRAKASSPLAQAPSAVLSVLHQLEAQGVRELLNSTLV